MKKFIKRYSKVLALAVLVVVAGCSYSCKDEGQGELLSGIESGQENENAGEGMAESGIGIETISETSSETPLAAPCFVHVCGEVRNPGVYELQEGQRVFQAIAMAGGFSDYAARDYLNQAEMVWDGMKLQVPSQEQASDPDWINPFGNGSDGSTTGTNQRSGHAGGSQDRAGSSEDHIISPSEKVNLNTAAKEELMTLRGIGEARALDIIRYRQEKGGFERIEDIMEISGIKDAAFQKIKDDITV